MRLFGFFFAIFDFFSFWESIKKTEVSKNVFFSIEILRSLKNLQILKIANFFFVIFVKNLSQNVFFCRKSGDASAEGRSRDPINPTKYPFFAIIPQLSIQINYDHIFCNLTVDPKVISAEGRIKGNPRITIWLSFDAFVWLFFCNF